MVFRPTSKTWDIPCHGCYYHRSRICHSPRNCKGEKTWSSVLCNLSRSNWIVHRSWSQYHVLLSMERSNSRWLGSNVAPHYKRSAAVGFQQSLANTAGVVAGQIYVTSGAPEYFVGHGVSLGSIVMAGVGYCILMAHLRHLNARKDRNRQELEKEGKDTDVGEGDLSLNFRYHL